MTYNVFVVALNIAQSINRKKFHITIFGLVEHDVKTHLFCLLILTVLIQ